MSRKETPAKDRPLLQVKKDIVFRIFFADERNEEELVSFLKSVINLPDEEYRSIEIADPHLLPENIGDKYAVIDVKLYTKTRKVIHIEVQLQVSPPMKNRIMFYGAKLIAEQMGSGGEYGQIQKVISIVITDEDLIGGSPRYHHRFTMHDPDAGVEFTDILEIHAIELKKLPESADGTELYDWAKFIAAKTEEDLKMVEQRNPQVRKAAVKLRKLSADEQARDMIERREKGMRDYAMFMKSAKMEGRAEGRVEVARNALRKGMSVDDVADITGLTREEVEALREND